MDDQRDYAEEAANRQLSLDEREPDEGEFPHDRYDGHEHEYLLIGDGYLGRCSKCGHFREYW